LRSGGECARRDRARQDDADETERVSCHQLHSIELIKNATRELAKREVSDTLAT